MIRVISTAIAVLWAGTAQAVTHVIWDESIDGDISLFTYTLPIDTPGDLYQVRGTVSAGDVDLLQITASYDGPGNHAIFTQGDIHPGPNYLQTFVRTEIGSTIFHDFSITSIGDEIAYTRTFGHVILIPPTTVPLPASGLLLAGAVLSFVLRRRTALSTQL
jgi:hypothetical protein